MNSAITAGEHKSVSLFQRLAEAGTEGGGVCAVHREELGRDTVTQQLMHGTSDDSGRVATAGVGVGDDEDAGHA